MKTIKTILDKQWETVLDKNLGWWAHIDAYKDDLSKSLWGPIYACELDGADEVTEFPIVSLNHHWERAHEKATILQVLDILGIPASLEHKLIAANDSGYIPAMQKLLVEEWITNLSEIKKMIDLIRLQDRQAQGITAEQELAAQEGIQTKEVLLDGKLIKVVIPHSKCATVTDRLFGLYKNLIICSGDGELNFYGDGKICEDLKTQFKGRNGWSWLGELGGDAYRGGYPNHEEAITFVINNLQ